MDFYRMLKPGIWAMRLPLFGPWLAKRYIKPGADAHWFIPVGQPIPAGARTVLPGQVIEHLLRQSDGVYVMAACPCRTAFHCKDHPQDLGCLFLGPAVHRITDKAGKVISLEEGLTHLQKALAAGLVPTILHIEAEGEIFKVEKGQLLAICFCCECCCDVRILLRQGPERYWQSYSHRLPGMTVVVDERCTRCGTCLETCYGGSRIISIESDRAHINEDCIGCGRCIPACPQGAISLAFDPEVNVLDELLERIQARVAIGPARS